MFIIAGHRRIAAQHLVLAQPKCPVWNRRLGDFRTASSSSGRRLPVPGRPKVFQSSGSKPIKSRSNSASFRSRVRCAHLLVPCRILGDAVVGDHQRPALVGSGGRHHHRTVQGRACGRRQSAVSRHQHTVAADQAWITKPNSTIEAAICATCARMGPGVSRIRSSFSVGHCSILRQPDMLMLWLPAARRRPPRKFGRTFQSHLASGKFCKNRFTATSTYSAAIPPP